MDVIEQVGNSVIQHGKSNNRVYLMKADPGDMPWLPDGLESLAARENYTKIFMKVPESCMQLLSDRDYVLEASVPGYYNGEENALFMSRFLDGRRQENARQAVHEAIVAEALSRRDKTTTVLPEGYSIRRCGPAHAEQMASLYRKTLETYPFPIHDPGYLARTMADNVVYFGVFGAGELVALSSAEKDAGASAAEMTDFATLPEYRGKGLSSCLLKQTEEAMKAEGIKTAYTIARAESYGMNIVFARCGYEYRGRLVNNTDIAGDIESMNIWYRRL